MLQTVQKPGICSAENEEEGVGLKLFLSACKQVNLYM